ncbi:MAG: hypothetical protein AAF253_11610 [Pseudomonadota bacterium]
MQMTPNPYRSQAGCDVRAAEPARLRDARSGLTLGSTRAPRTQNSAYEGLTFAIAGKAPELSAPVSSPAREAIGGLRLVASGGAIV